MSTVRRQSLRLRGQAAAAPLGQVAAPQPKKRPRASKKANTENIKPSNTQGPQQVSLVNWCLRHEVLSACMLCLT